MSFNYHKNKEHGSQDSFWTSYSDLFLGLSTIFLLLYVTASLRSGADGIRTQMENQKLSMQVEELKHQLNVYESVKNEYMEKQASKDEVQEYQELMDKLTLLQEDAKTEKDRLIQQALENENKVKALNKYQQMVRNVLNANKMAKSKISNRDDVIKDQDVEIETKKAEIAKREEEIVGLNKDIDEKKQLISQGEAKIKQAEQTLEQRMRDLKSAYKKNKLTKALYEKQMAQAKAESAKKVQQLAEVNSQIQGQLQQASAQLGAIEGELSKTKGLLNEKAEEATQLAGALSKTKVESQAKIAEMEAGLDAERKAGARKVAALKGELDATQGQLAKAKAEIDARKQVASEIQKGFAKAGVKADIDMQTGDVVLDFGQTYFDSGSDRLKREMKGVIEKAMPIYSKSLFGNPKVSNKISSVEIIGFASPTYKGRYVDPQSSKAEDKAALKYNMDLSYRRANSIFTYMLDNQSTNFAHQKELLSRMKVSGRSFLEVMKVQNRNVASAVEFCKQNDCKKAQRVIIRFSMDPKK